MRGGLIPDHVTEERALRGEIDLAGHLILDEEGETEEEGRGDCTASSSDLITQTS